MRPAHEQLEYISRTVDVALPEGALLDLLEEDRPLRVKLGVDPTAPDVTLGWAVVFDLLRRFQDMGHIAVLIVGDFTAQVGDPSEKSETRKRLSAEHVRSYADRLLPIIRTQLLPERLEIRYNSEWLAAMDMGDVLELTSEFTVARIMDRDDFTKRWDAHQPISMIEFLYPLLQGMDSVAIRSDVEIGGTDQLWNLLVGRDLQERREVALKEFNEDESHCSFEADILFSLAQAKYHRFPGFIDFFVQDGTSFLAMELLGRSLQSILEERMMAFTQATTC